MDNKQPIPIACLLLAASVVIGLLRTLVNAFQGFFSFWNLLIILSNAAICATVFMKKRDIMLLGAVTLRTVFQLMVFARTPSFFGFLEVIAWAALVLLALCVCEQEVIKLDLSKIVDMCKKLYFVPAAIIAVCNVVGFFTQIGFIGFFRAFGNLILALVTVAAVYFFSQWLVNPEAAPTLATGGTAKTGTAALPGTVTATGTVSQTAYEEGYCSMGKHIVLCLFTCGIWYLIWIYRTTKFLNNADGAEQHNPVNKLLLCLFIPFYQIYWFYKQGQRIDNFAKQRNLHYSDMASICLLLGIFIPFVACILMQDRINSICTAK